MIFPCRMIHIRSGSEVTVKKVRADKGWPNHVYRVFFDEPAIVKAFMFHKDELLNLFRNEETHDD